MFNSNDLKKTILDFRRSNIPEVLVEAESSEALDILQKEVVIICNEIGLQVLCERSEFQLKIRNLFFSNN